ncbi:MAG: hypothetical protein AAFX85_17245, partial [Pseudomonadota bacterium]
LVEAGAHEDALAADVRAGARDVERGRDARGEAMASSLLRTRFGLWSPDGRRLTVLLNPGRVKTGLEAHERFGAVLEQGRHYALRIERELRDRRGCALGAVHEKRFLVGPADRTPPVPDRWSLQLPAVQTRDAFSVTLQGLTDHLSLAYRLRVLDDDGRTLAGNVTLANHEQVWRFAPTQNWESGRYTLRVDPALEDLAGNRPTGLFDDPTPGNRTRSARAMPIERIFTLSD